MAAPWSTRKLAHEIVSMGRPMLASVVTRNAVASHGAAVATPP